MKTNTHLHQSMYLIRSIIIDQLKLVVKIIRLKKNIYYFSYLKRFIAKMLQSEKNLGVVETEFRSFKMTK